MSVELTTARCANLRPELSSDARQIRIAVLVAKRPLAIGGHCNTYCLGRAIVKLECIPRVGRKAVALDNKWQQGLCVCPLQVEM